MVMKFAKNIGLAGVASLLLTGCTYQPPPVNLTAPAHYTLSVIDGAHRRSAIDVPIPASSNILSDTQVLVDSVGPWSLKPNKTGTINEIIINGPMYNVNVMSNQLVIRFHNDPNQVGAVHTPITRQQYQQIRRDAMVIIQPGEWKKITYGPNP
ncbi:MAG: hypothetical protein M0Z50_06945 [Planctomycetia bacterium]|nr:hypothetical protein [Planctomycetia bacterium]